MVPCAAMKFGPFSITVTHDGGFRLDGGAMFGVVPKVLWAKQTPADDQNRIAMVTNSLLVERGDDLLVIETGIGDKNDAKFRSRFGMDEGAERLPAAIERCGYALGDVTHVLCTHLHFDHCGWNTRAGADGRLVPTFPAARYWLQRQEVAHARHPNARDAASYDARNWEPLFEAGVVELFDDAAEPISGVCARRAPGHNADMCVVTLDGGDDGQAIVLADLVPTAAHLPTPWVMGFDLFPLETMKHKAEWIGRAAAGDWLCFFTPRPRGPERALGRGSAGSLSRGSRVLIAFGRSRTGAAFGGGRTWRRWWRTTTI